MDVGRLQANNREKMVKKYMEEKKETSNNNNLAIDVGKRKCRAAIKDAQGTILDEFFFANDRDGRTRLIEAAQIHAPCKAALESTGNMWIKIHDALEQSGIDTKVAHPYKTRIIAEARIKSDKLDARILADLLRADMISESYVPPKEFREKRALVRHRVALTKNRTMLENRIHSLLDKYDYTTDLTDIFGKSGLQWLKSLQQLSPIDKVIMDTSLAAIENINAQIDTVSREICKYAWDSEDVRIILSMTGIGIFSAMLISAEIVDIRRFLTPWKLVSYAGLAPGSRESAGKTKNGRITKQGSPWLRWTMVQCAQVAARHDPRMKAFYERLRSKKGAAKATVAVAKEMLVIIWYMLTRRQLYNGVKQERYEEKFAQLGRTVQEGSSISA
jgi:transposase